MPYHYLEDIGTADIAFEATGRDLPELFAAAADATMNVMIDNLDAIESRETRQIELSGDKIDMLLFDFLQELIYFKDAKRLLLRTRETQIDHKGEEYHLILPLWCQLSVSLEDSLSDGAGSAGPSTLSV